jgi:hypothetical protein
MKRHEITPKLKERFCKDRNLPIKIFDEAVFLDRLDLMESQYNARSDYEKFVKMLEKFSNEDEYFKTYSQLKDAAIERLKNNIESTDFNSRDFNEFAVKKYNFPTKDIYHKSNVGKKFLSLDMIKGNFTALRHYNPNIVDNCYTFEEFISQFTNEEHLISSKYIRQVIFGNNNPKRQVAYEKYLMGIVLKKVLQVFKNEDIAYFSTDEIVVCLESYTEKELKNKIKEVSNIVNESYGENINIRAEYFMLESIENTDGYIKKFFENKKGYEVKKINHLIIPFVLRALNNEYVKPFDQIFIFEDKKAQLLEYPEIESI